MLCADHVVFPVFRPAESLAFYAEVLELPLVQALEGDDWGGRAWLMMIFGLADGRELVLVALRGAEPPPPDGLALDVRHYAFSVENRAAYDRILARLSAAGLEYWQETHGERVSLYFPDPDGVILEVTTPPSAAAQVADPAAMAHARAWMANTPP